MGFLTSIFAGLFGGGRNVVRETFEVFRPNAEAQSQRGHTLDAATLNQMAAEFAVRGQRGWFDRLMDGVNRLPRPMMVTGVFGLLVWTSFDPISAAQVFTSWAIIPTEFWYVVLAIVTFYFGGRAQAKAQDMQERLAGVAGAVPAILNTLSELEDMRPETAESPGSADTGPDVVTQDHALDPDDNAALEAWRAKQ